MCIAFPFHQFKSSLYEQRSTDPGVLTSKEAKQHGNKSFTNNYLVEVVRPVELLRDRYVSSKPIGHYGKPKKKKAYLPSVLLPFDVMLKLMSFSLIPICRRIIASYFVVLV